MIFKVVATALGTVLVVGGGITIAHYRKSIFGSFDQVKQGFNDSRKTKIWLDDSGNCQSENKTFGGFVANRISQAIASDKGDGGKDICSRLTDESFDGSIVEIDSEKMGSKYKEVTDKEKWKEKTKTQSS